MALSKKDSKAVAKAAKAGGLSSSQTKSVISNTNAGKSMAPTSATSNTPTKTSVAPTGASSAKFIRDKSGGLVPVAPGQDVEKLTSQVKGTRYLEPGKQTTPEDEGTIPETPAAPTLPKTQMMGEDTITDPVTGQSFTKGAEAGSIYQPNKFKQALASAQSSGLPAPADGGAAKMGMQSFVPQEQDTSVVDALYQSSPELQGIMKLANDYFSPDNQKNTLLSEYKKLEKSSGLNDLDEEIIDAETIIDGTEDDIRNEVQMAGGFATDSQVQAMSLSRNKSLLKRYNQLVSLREQTQKRLDTMMNLTAQDRQIAQQRFTTQLNVMTTIANFRQQAENNVREAFNNMVAKVGYAGAFRAYQSDPRQLGFIERTMGLQPGGLKSLAGERDLDRELKLASIAKANERSTAVVDVGGRKYLIDSQTGNTIKEIGGGLGASGVESLAKKRASIEETGKVLDLGGLGSAVGPNYQSRGMNGFVDGVKRFFTGAGIGAAAGAAAGAPFAGVGAIPGAIGGAVIGGIGNTIAGAKGSLTGEKQNFITTVEQIGQGLTLEELADAKSSGITFGSLTEGERDAMGEAATKLMGWRIKDGDKVVGYDVAENDFRKEIDKIEYFKKLDYIMSGGEPSDIRVQETPDGRLWAVNSFGQVVELR